MTRMKSGTPSSVSLVERPTSRLSNRSTRKPLDAMASQKRTSHAIICIEKPITRATVGAPASPMKSYSSSTDPETLARGMKGFTTNAGLAGATLAG